MLSLFLRQKHKSSSALLNRTRIKCDSLYAVDSGLKSSSSSSCFSSSSSSSPLSPLPQTAGEWAQVLQLQRQFHQAQLSKWQQILQSSVSLLDQVGVPLQFALAACFSSQIITQRVPLCLQMKQSLEKLHQGIVVPEVKQDPPADAESLTEA